MEICPYCKTEIVRKPPPGSLYKPSHVRGCLMDYIWRSRQEPCNICYRFTCIDLTHITPEIIEAARYYGSDGEPEKFTGVIWKEP